MRPFVISTRVECKLNEVEKSPEISLLALPAYRLAGSVEMTCYRLFTWAGSSCKVRLGECLNNHHYVITQLACLPVGGIG